MRVSINALYQTYVVISSLKSSPPIFLNCKSRVRLFKFKILILYILVYDLLIKSWKI